MQYFIRYKSHHRVHAKAIAIPACPNIHPRFLPIAAILVIINFMAVTAHSKPVIDNVTQGEINRLYEELMKRPSDRSLNLQYSTTLAKAGDYEAAIPPLERILVNEPENAWLMLQLGTLYKSLNSNVMARTYLYQAIQSPNADPDTVEKAKALLSSL